MPTTAERESARLAWRLGIGRGDPPEPEPEPEAPTAPVLSVVEPVTDPPSFTAVIDDTVGENDSYWLQVQADGGDWSTLLVDDTDTITSGEDAANQIDATVSALGAGNYDARMAVRDGSGPWSSWSNVVDVVITASEPAYVARGVYVPVDPFDANTTLNFTVNIGDAADDRIVWVFPLSQNNNEASAVSVNGTSLTQNESTAGSNTAELWSALVTTGSGAVTIAVTWPSGAYNTRAIAVVTTTGDLEIKDTSVLDAAVSVTAGDFVFGAAWHSTSLTDDWTEAPDLDSDTIGSFTAYLATLEAASTNASFVTDWSTSPPFASLVVVVGPA